MLMLPSSFRFLVLPQIARVSACSHPFLPTKLAVPDACPTAGWRREAALVAAEAVQPHEEAHRLHQRGIASEEGSLFFWLRCSLEMAISDDKRASEAGLKPSSTRIVVSVSTSLSSLLPAQAIRFFTRAIAAVCACYTSGVQQETAAVEEHPAEVAFDTE